MLTQTFLWLLIVAQMSGDGKVGWLNYQWSYLIFYLSIMWHFLRHKPLFVLPS